jgi:hypothetical protein
MYLLISAFAISLPLRSIADDATKKRFLEEYPTGIQSFRNRLASYSCKVEHESASEGIRIETRFWQNANLRRIHAIGYRNDGDREIRSEEVVCDGQGVEFELIRANETDPFIVEHLVNWDQHQDDPYFKGKTYTDFRTSLVSSTPEPTVSLCKENYAFHRLFEPEEWLIPADRSKLIDVALTENPAGLVRVRYSMDEYRNYNTIGTALHETVLDPENHWAMVSDYRSFSNDPDIGDGLIVEYGPKIDGIAMPKSLRIKKNGVLSAPFLFKDWSFDPISPEVFSLKVHGPLTTNWQYVIQPHSNGRFTKFAVGSVITCLLLLVQYSRIKCRQAE